MGQRVQKYGSAGAWIEPAHSTVDWVSPEEHGSMLDGAGGPSACDTQR